ncbi:MAG TPA: amidohydrolase [Candidatus Spyradenecus faecavium]|uniref:Amidohydrolase n=1 Tax=Candidatus Spyradenecus faecavium TaxID=2840947 RepID=A0A9D1T246_9BACT|nr:amidohydrolase [Candidatus Spyradenecus faecavium]
MFDLILSNALLRGRRVDIAVRGAVFAAVEPAGALAHAEAHARRDCSRFLLRPPFYNTHTHQAMTLLRGIDDDCALMDWLTREIWPREARLTPDAVHAGTRLAILEGLRSGCVAFNDMYFHQPAVIRAAVEMGVRARVGLMFMDQVSDHIENDAALALRDALPPTVGLSLAPHALYTTTPDLLRRVAAQADALGLPLHIHAAETLAETAIAKERFGFDSPIAYLDACGILRPGAVLAHCCHATEADLALIADRGCFVAHCPQSNQKLASGVFPWAKAAAAGVRITVGTDGAASNNGLSMIAEAKAAALSAKLGAGTPDALRFADLDRAVTETAAEALGFPNAGRIAPGADADFILVDLDTPAFAGGGDPDANFVYAADSACVDTVACAGRLLLEGRRLLVADEAALLADARAASETLRAPSPKP